MQKKSAIFITAVLLSILLDAVVSGIPKLAYERRHDGSTAAECASIGKGMPEIEVISIADRELNHLDVRETQNQIIFSRSDDGCVVKLDENTRSVIEKRVDERFGRPKWID